MRARIVAITLPLTLILAAVAMFLPTGFVVRSPGPTRDTLGVLQSGGSALPLVEISGTDTFATSGQLRLTTVSVAGGPIGPVLPLDALVAWAVPSRSAVPVETVFRIGMTRQQQQQQSAAQMITSQEAATAAALNELGFEIPTTLTIVGTGDNSHAEGVVEPDDIVHSLNGVAVVNQGQLLDMLGGIEPGTVVTLTVLRDGELHDLPILTGSAATGEGGERAALGVFLATDFDFPIDVEIQIDNIGGPSAGMVFALAIIDRLTEVDELQGVSVAGTGTIDASGAVGAIGGVVQKMHGALRDGSLVPDPVANCAEVIGSVPRGLNVVAVSTLGEALEAVTAIGSGDVAGLPNCAAALAAATQPG